MFVYSFIYVMSIAFQELLTVNYNIEHMSNIIVRFYHSIISTYYITPILYNIGNIFIDYDKISKDDELNKYMMYSIYFYIWDSLFLIINDEDKKMLIFYNVLRTIIISYSIYFKINTYFTALGLISTEIVNFFIQISEFCYLINYNNELLEKFHFIFTMIIICSLIQFNGIYNAYNIYEYYSKYGTLDLTIIFNLSSYYAISNMGVEWIENKYYYIMTYY